MTRAMRWPVLTWRAICLFLMLHLGGYSTSIAGETLKQEIEAALQSCDSIQRASAVQICRSTIASRVDATEFFVNRALNNAEAILTVGRQSQEPRATGRWIGAGRTSGQHAAAIARGQSALGHLEHVQAGTVALQESIQSVQASLSGLAGMFATHRSDTEFVCRLRDTARIDCATLADILAQFDNAFGEIILSDIDRVYEVYDLPFDHRVLFGCGPGLWSSMQIQGSAAEFEALMADTGYSAIVSSCSELADSMTSEHATAASGSGGMSGISGFDTFAKGLCGIEAPGGDFNEFVTGALEMAEEMREGCTATLQETMMATLRALPLPNGTNKDGTDKEVIEILEIIQNEDGKTEHVVRIDGNGNVFAEFDRDSQSTADSLWVEYEDGSTGSIVDEGHIVTQEDQSPDGTIVKTKYDDRVPDIVTERTTSPDGHWSEKTLEYDGDVWREMATLDITPIPNVSRHHNRIRSKFNQMCSGEPCSSCYEFDQLNPRLQGVEPGDREGFWVLRSFDRSSSCCSNQEAYPGDPRVSTPNPEGDFVCRGSADLDLVQGACADRCSVAEAESCVASCMGSFDNRGLFNITLLDTVCSKMISDACFIHDGRFPLPPPEPLPTPDLEAEELLFEPYLAWEQSIIELLPPVLGGAPPIPASAP